MSDYRERVIETLADSEAALRDRVADLEADLYWHREINRAAIHALHDLTMRFDRQQARYHRLLDERRALRGAPRQEAA